MDFKHDINSLAFNPQHFSTFSTIQLLPIAIIRDTAYIYSNLVVFTILGSPNFKKNLLCKTEGHLLRSPDCY